MSACSCLISSIIFFDQMFLELLNDLFTYSLESLLNQFQEDGSSDYYTWYIRLLTAGISSIELFPFFHYGTLIVRNPYRKLNPFLTYFNNR